MIKFMILLLSILAFTPVEEHESSFLNEVDRGYSYYVIESSNNSYYSITIAQGVYDGKPAYGICFTSVEAGAYNLVIEMDDTKFVLEQDSRKDSKAVAIVSSFQINLTVYDKDGNKQNYVGKSTLDKFTVNSFMENENKIKGEGLGKNFSQLKVYTQEIPFFKTFIVVLLSVVGISSFFIVLLFILRKGLFDKNKRKLGTVNIKDLLKEETYDHTNEDYLDNYKKTVEENNDEVEEKPQVDQIDDVKAYLRENGYITDYKVLTEEEKNRVMLELIKLKNSNKISLNKYYEETSELWKK